MKRSLIFIICTIILIMSAVSISALEAEETTLTMGKDEQSQAILEAFSKQIEHNSKMTEYEDGTLVFEFTPYASSITIEEIPERPDVINVSMQPQYFTQLPDYSYTTGQTHTPVSFEQNYLYSLYNDEYKARYRSIEQSAKGFAETTEYFQANDYQEILTLYRSFLFDNPEYFYISTTCSIYQRANEYAIGFVYSIGNQSGDSAGYGYGNMTESLKTRINAKKAVFDQTVSDFISTIPADAPDVIKERLVYAKILRSSFYNLDALYNDLWDGLANDNWTAYGIAVNGMGVCESYSEAFQTMCKAVGIPCTGITGVAGGGHKWNAVQIGGQWYQCDITFDDPVGNGADDAYSHYFNLTDTEMAEYEHDWSSCEYPVPTCTATGFGRDNFFQNFEEDSEGTIHFFASRCDSTCENCSFTRYADDHKYGYDNTCIYCGMNPSKKNGWFEENNERYFYENDVKVTNDWRNYADALCYLDEQGRMVYDTFVYHNDGMAYIDENGYFYTSRNGWVYCQGSRYLLENGYRVENRWVIDSFGYCFLDGNGRQVYNTFIEDTVGWAYIGENGYFSSDYNGTVYVSDDLFYVQNGYKVTDGWITLDNVKYFLADGNIVKNQWIFDSFGKCFLDENGQQLSNAFIEDPDGIAYIGEDGYFSSNYSGTVYINNELFFVQNGYKITDGWVNINGTWFFLRNNTIVKNQWVEDANGNRYYVDENGYKVNSSWIKNGDKWAYVNQYGIFEDYTGWVLHSGIRYYLENGYRLENSWAPDSYGYRFVNENGEQVNNAFISDETGLAYIESDGYFKYRNGWLFYNNKWYFLEGGYAVTNDWRLDSMGWCYLGEDGAMLTDAWMKDSTGWCYLDASGYWDGVYHKSNRFEKNGWYQEGDDWYYYEDDEKVTNSWRIDSTGWCFLDEEGKWVLDAFVRDSTGWAYITKDGYFYYNTNGWVDYHGTWYFLENGYAVTSQWRADSIGWCYLSETGAMVTNGFVADSVGLAYITADGYFYYTENGWRDVDGKWYFIESGYAVMNQWRLDSTGWCYLGEDGAMLTDAWMKDSTGWCYLDKNGYWDGKYHSAPAA